MNTSDTLELAWEDDMVILGHDSVRDYNEEGILPQSPETLSQIRSWLQPTNYDGDGSEHMKHLSSHLAGTGGWLLTSKAYQQWHASNDHGTLWIRGIPGSGKSVIAATLIHHLAREGVPVLYFYFRQTVDANHSPVSLLRDWLVQILIFSPPLQAQLKKYMDGRRSLESLTMAEFWSGLRTALSRLPKVYCVVDALDEMDLGGNIDAFILSLAELGQWQPSRIKLIITSRPVAVVERPLRLKKIIHIQLDEKVVNVDIAFYIRNRLAASAIAVEDHAPIKSAVLGRADGLFLFAKLAMDAFLEPGADVQKVLQELPADLNVIYTEVLLEHIRRSGIPDHIQLLILELATHTTRQLRLLELADVINVTQFPKHDQNIKATKHLVRAACGPLLEILPDETVCVIHHSLTEFLNGTLRQSTSHDYPILTLGSTHNHLALVCLGYLQSGGLDVLTGLTARIRTPFERKETRFPFAAYAAHNWYVHVRKAASAGHDQSKINAVLDKFLVGETLEQWTEAVTNHRFRHEERRRYTPLMAALQYELDEYAKLLLSRPGIKVDKTNHFGRSPIILATLRGYESIVDLLLRLGANADESSSEGWTALHCAAKGNHPKLITLLIHAAGGSSYIQAQQIGIVDKLWVYEEWSRDRPTGPPLMYACQDGHVEAVAAFLPHLQTPALVNAALGWAVKNGRVSVATLILQHPLADVNEPSQRQTPLCLACSQRNVAMVKVLLQAHANPNVESEESGLKGSLPRPRGEPALDAWARWRRTRGTSWPFKMNELDREATRQCFHLLLAAGANVHHADQEGNTALHYVDDIVAYHCLLEAGINPNIVNHDGESLLHLCQNPAITRLLLEDPKVAKNPKTRSAGHTPLFSSLSKGNITHVLQLLDFGADAKDIDNAGNGAFHYFVGMNDLGNDGQRLIKGLLAAGADLNMRNRNGQTPLHLFGKRTMISQDLWLKTVTDLLAAGADPEVRDNQGETPLFQSLGSKELSTKQRIELFETMAMAGARLDTVDVRGRNLLHYCFSSTQYDLEFSRFLIGKGVDPKQIDYEGNTLFHLAALLHAKSCCHKKTYSLFEELIGLGVDVNQPNYSGRTPLHLVSTIFPSGLADGKIGPDRRTTAFDCILQLQKNVDYADLQGVTALHLTSTFSEYQTRRLLQAGADLAKATHEGLTVLHLAARSWQANILGMLLDFLQLHGNRGTLSTMVNAKDICGRTALFYACASGRIESVTLLIEMGARVKSDMYPVSVWEGCVAFEDEVRNWKLNNSRHHEDSAPPHVGAVVVSDHMRPRLFKQGSYSTARLDEIVELLSAHETQEGFLESAIMAAGRGHLEYTVDCLWHARCNLGTEDDLELDFSTSATLCGRQANRRAWDELLPGKHQPSPAPLRSQFRELMHLREYDLVGELLVQERYLEFYDDGDLIVNHLVLGGFASLVKRIVTPEAARKLEDFAWCEQHAGSPRTWDQLDRAEKIQPLLRTACQRELPNLDVLRVLVEDVGVNINAPERKDQRQAYIRPDWPRYVKGGSALHYLAGSPHHWWHLKAFQYLVKHGADIEMADEMGRTPLASALDHLDHIGMLALDTRTVELLIELGADVNREDHHGVSCLARATDEMDLVRLLLQHGAVVTPSALLAAITKRRPDVLEALLVSGGPPNTRLSSTQVQAKTRPSASYECFRSRPGEVPPEADAEMYPLHYAAVQSSPDREMDERLVRLLLQYGADPGARYPQTTVMHRIIEGSSLVHLFLERSLPALDLETRDSAGLTLLMAACYARCGQRAGSGTDVVRELLNRGSDIRARDNNGQNILHHLLHPLLQAESSEFNSRAALEITARAPELVNEFDKQGNTPFHLAINRLRLEHRGTAESEALLALLAAGAHPQLANRKGNTPLHLLLGSTWLIDVDVGVIGEARDVFDCLLKLGAEMNARNDRGETPIFAFFRDGMVTVKHTHLQPGLPNKTEPQETPVLELFDQAGVDWFAVSNAGETLLHVVPIGGWDPTGSRQVSRFEFLIEKGLDLMYEDENGKTPADVATERNAKHILELIKGRCSVKV